MVEMLEAPSIHSKPQQSVESAPEVVRTFTDYPTIREKVVLGCETGRVVILFTDVDGTLVLGAGHHAPEIEQGQRDMERLVKALNAQGAIIIPITGSHFDSGTNTTHSILDRIERGVLPHVGVSAPDSSFAVDAYVSDGGARSVHALSGQDVSYDSSYIASVQPATLDYDQLLSHTQSLAAVINQRNLSDEEQSLIAMYDTSPETSRVFLQPGTESGSHRGSNKIAFYFYASSLNERDQIEASFAGHVKDFGMRVVCCEEKDATTAARRHPMLAEPADNLRLPLKYCLDIAPFDKGMAVRHFSDYVLHLIVEQVLATGKERPALEVWACGDSGNDFSLLSSDIVTHAVIVGGASKELLRLGDRLKEHGKSVYIETDPSRLGPTSIAQAILGKEY